MTEYFIDVVYAGVMYNDVKNMNGYLFSSQILALRTYMSALSKKNYSVTGNKLLFLVCVIIQSHMLLS